MDRDPAHTTTGQDPLIVAHPESGAMMLHNMADGPFINFEAARLHRLNVLSLFGAINQREMYYQYHQNREVAADDELRRQAILQGINNKRQAFEREAEDEFYQSVGLYDALAHTALYPTFDYQAFQADARRQWRVFQARFRGMDRTYARSDHRRQLLQGWTPSDINRQFSEFDRDHDLRPFISKKDANYQAQQGSDYPLLSTRERLVALQDDPRAGFLPTTNREKSTSFTYLDYLDNPDYPLGVTNQLFEVFIHQQRLDKWSAGDTAQERAEKLQRVLQRPRSSLHMALRSLESITYEMGDYLQSSRLALAGLSRLHDFLQTGDSHPKLAIGVEVPLQDIGLRALIQYRHLSLLRDKGRTPPHIPDPLLTREDRIRKEADRTAGHTGRNKTVEDIYTRRVLDAPTLQRLGEAATAMTIREARAHIGDAIVDKQRRAAFYEMNLRSIVELAPNEGLLTIGDIAQEVLAAA